MCQAYIVSCDSDCVMWPCQWQYHVSLLRHASFPHSQFSFSIFILSEFSLNFCKFLQFHPSPTETKINFYINIILIFLLNLIFLFKLIFLLYIFNKTKFS